MLLPSPKKYSESFRRKELTEFARAQIEEILIKLRQAKIYSEEDRLAALKTRYYWEPMDEFDQNATSIIPDDAKEDMDFEVYE
jgi:hypothetical protein